MVFLNIYQGSLPFLKINVMLTEIISYILLCILCYLIIRLFIEWFLSYSDYLKHISIKIDLILTIIISVISICFLFKILDINFTIPNINILLSLAIIAVGVFGGEFLYIVIFIIAFIRSKEKAKKKALSLIFVSFRFICKMFYISFFLFLNIIFLSLSFTLSLLYFFYFFLFFPIFFFTLSGLSSMFFSIFIYLYFYSFSLFFFFSNF